MGWAGDRLGRERIEGAYAWRKLIDSGCRIACGSDFPVEAVNPIWGIYAAVTRQDHEGSPDGGWHAEERMTLDEALRGFTTDAAYASFMEHVKGQIQPGMLADLTILDRDLYAATPREILSARVIGTVVGGAVLYEAGPSSGGKP